MNFPRVGSALPLFDYAFQGGFEAASIDTEIYVAVSTGEASWTIIGCSKPRLEGNLQAALLQFPTIAVPYTSTQDRNMWLLIHALET